MNLINVMLTEHVSIYHPDSPVFSDKQLNSTDNKQLSGEGELCGTAAHHTHSGFLDLSQLSRASLLKAAVAALLLLFR